MIAIHYDATGALVAPLVRDGQTVDGPVTGLLPGAVGQVTLDEATNPAALAALGGDWGAHTVAGGVLLRGGVPVALNPPSAAVQADAADAEALGTLYPELAGLIPQLLDPTHVWTAQALAPILGKALLGEKAIADRLRRKGL